MSDPDRFVRFIRREVQVTPTPEEVAEIFLAWNDEQQATFLNHLGRSVPEGLLERQLCCVSTNPALAATGRRVMRQLGEWSEEPAPDTQEDRDLMREYIKRMRQRAEPIGSMHSWWDTIGDGESLLCGGPTIVYKSCRQFNADAAKTFNKWGLEKPQ